MKQYVDDDPDEDWSESFWQIKLYTAEDLHDRPARSSLADIRRDHDGRFGLFERPPESADSASKH